MSFDQAEQGRDSVRAAPEHVTVRLLQEALRGGRGLAGAIYALDPASSTYAISSSFGIELERIEPERIERVRASCVFTVGDPRGLVGLVARTREPEYVPNFDAQARWFNELGVLHVGSVYIAPIVSGAEVPAVVAVVSDSESGISKELRGSIDSLTGLAARFLGVETALSERIERVQREMRNVALGWNEIVDVLRTEPASELNDRLQAISRREWEVIEGLQAGRRVATIARQLGISPHTVRNHVKSISRKLGVRSHDELREYLGTLRVGRSARS